MWFWTCPESGGMTTPSCRIRRKWTGSWRGLKAAGCGGIVEVTNRGMGRDVEALWRMSERHGLPIVAATGYYKQTYYPEEVKEQSEEEIEELFVRELAEGIGDTGVRAGIIAEIGSSLNEMTAEEAKVLRAAARPEADGGSPQHPLPAGDIGTGAGEAF